MAGRITGGAVTLKSGQTKNANEGEKIMRRQFMKSKFWSVTALAAATFVAGMAASLPLAAQGWQPTRPVTFVIPAGTGGGADQMARFIQGVVSKHNLMSQTLIVLNKAGGAGAEGF